MKYWGSTLYVMVPKLSDTEGPRPAVSPGGGPKNATNIDILHIEQVGPYDFFYCYS